MEVRETTIIVEADELIAFLQENQRLVDSQPFMLDSDAVVDYDNQTISLHFIS